MPPGAPPRAPRTAPGLHFYRFWGAFFVRFLSFFDTLNAKGRRKKIRKKASIPFCFCRFFGDETPGTVQNCHRALRATSDRYGHGGGKAEGNWIYIYIYTPRQSLAAGVLTFGYDQFLIIPTRGVRPLPPADKSEPKMHQNSGPEKDTYF